MINIMKCKNCGSQNGVVDLHNGFYQCVACGAWIKKEGTGGNTACSIGYDHINNFDFTKAETTFDGILREDPCSRDALWGKLLARFGIVFLRGYGEAVSKPTFCFSKEDIGTARFTDQKEYKTLMELSRNDADSREIYQKKAKEIDNQLSDIKGDLAKKCDYDVFICVKIGTAVDDNAPHTNQRTKDYEIAREIYNDLTAKGLKVFCSEISRRGQIEYDKEIWSAMLRSRKILVIGTRRDYLMSCWVRSEWKRWIYLIERGKRSRDTFVSYIPDDNWQDIRPLEWDTYRINIWKKEDYRKMIKQLCEGDSVAKQTSAPGTSDTFEDMVKNLRGLIIAGDWEEAEKALSKIPDNIKGRAEIQLLKIRYESLNFTEHGKIDHDKWNHVLTVAKKEKLNLKKNFEVIDYNEALKAWRKDAPKRKKQEKINKKRNEYLDLAEKRYKENITIQDFIRNSKTMTKESWKQDFVRNCEEIDEKGKKKSRRTTIIYSILIAILIGMTAYSFLSEKEFFYYLISRNKLVFTSNGDGTCSVSTGVYGYEKAELVIPENSPKGDRVTEIASNAFFGHINLTSITIPDSVTKIGEKAFASCKNVTGITIPESVTSIGDYAFEKCENLAEVTILGSVTYMGDNAFYHCSNLSTVVIQDGTTVIGDNAFYYCFDLANITIPESVTYIGDSAFHGCDNLLNITIPGSVKSIGDYAFGSCDNLTTVTIQDGVESIGNSAFWGCNNLLNIAISGSVKSIGSSAFKECENLSIVTIQDGVESIGMSAFEACAKLKSITIPGSVTDINYYVFKDCASLSGLIISNGVKNIKSSAFESCGSLSSVTIPDSVTNIGASAFRNCNNLMSVVIGSSVTEIGNDAFFSCDRLTEIYNRSALNITIGKGDNGEIGYYAKAVYTEPYKSRLMTDGDGFVKYVYDGKVWLINYLGKDADITVPADVTHINRYAFYKKAIKSVSLGENIVSIGFYSFGFCNLLESIEIPKNVEEINDFSFSNCTALKAISVDSANKKFSSLDGNLYSKDKKTFILYAPGKKDSSFVIPDGVTAIGTGAFYGHYELKSVTIPNGVTRIGGYAFELCSSITSIILPDSVTTIDFSAFGHCSSLTSVTIPDSVTKIDEWAFKYCSSLTSITIPANVSYIGEDAFGGCDKLTSVTFKNTNGWSAGSDPVNSYVLFDPAKAAELLKKGYVWTRTAQ